MASRIPLVRTLVEGAVEAMCGGEPGDRAVGRALRSARDLTREERRLVAEWAFGLALWRGRLDALARGDRRLWLALFLVDRERRTVDEAAALAGVEARKV